MVKQVNSRTKCCMHDSITLWCSQYRIQFNCARLTIWMIPTSTKHRVCLARIIKRMSTMSVSVVDNDNGNVICTKTKPYQPTVCDAEQGKN